MTSLDESAAPLPTSARREPRVAWACALSPLGALLVYISFAVHLRLGLGHWPMPMVEDYQTPIFQLHQWVLIACLFFAYLVSAPAYLLCFAIPKLRPASARIVGLQLALWLTGWLLFYAAGKYDPTPFSAWFAD